MATIHDVAKLAGVSIKTVSRVVNNEPRVRDTTRELVQKCITQLDYRPHQGARLMRSSKSGLIGLITSAISTVSRQPVEAGLSSIYIVKGIQQVCREAGKTLLIVDADSGADGIDDLIAKLESYQVEGIIYALDHHCSITPIKARNIPLWLVNGMCHGDIPSVVPDDYWGQYQAVEYLIEKGHRQLAYVGIPIRHEAARLRTDGFIDAAEKHGINRTHLDLVLGIEFQDNEPVDVLEQALETLIHKENRPTALCFFNDLMAMKASRIIQEKGFHIPEDFSVMGFDNDTVMATAIRPEITTVSLPYQRMGREVARQLLAQLENSSETEVVENTLLRVKGEVVERQSVSLNTD